LVKNAKRHLVRQGNVAVVLQEEHLAPRQQIVDRRIQLVEAFIEPQSMKLLTPFLNNLSDRSSRAAAFIAQQSEQSNRRPCLLAEAHYGWMLLGQIEAAVAGYRSGSSSF
jgi:hypothetical protein